LLALRYLILAVVDTKHAMKRHTYPKAIENIHLDHMAWRDFHLDLPQAVNPSQRKICNFEAIMIESLQKTKQLQIFLKSSLDFLDFEIFEPWIWTGSFYVILY
jgi:hypothetical protein